MSHFSRSIGSVGGSGVGSGVGDGSGVGFSVGVGVAVGSAVAAGVGEGAGADFPHPAKAAAITAKTITNAMDDVTFLMCCHLLYDDSGLPRLVTLPGRPGN